LQRAIHARINALPVTKSRRKAAPFAALLGHIQNCVEHLEVLKFYIPALNRQAVLDLFILLDRDLTPNITKLVLTRPSYLGAVGVWKKGKRSLLSTTGMVRRKFHQPDYLG
jgi:hypothetical protein